jgi:hypothetical protein
MKKKTNDPPEKIDNPQDALTMALYLALIAPDESSAFQMIYEAGVMVGQSGKSVDLGRAQRNASAWARGISRRQA